MATKSLKQLLHKEINETGYMTYATMQRICIDNKKRISNGERRLRPSESPNVDTLFNSKGHIIGYKGR